MVGGGGYRVDHRGNDDRHLDASDIGPGCVRGRGIEDGQGTGGTGGVERGLYGLGVDFELASVEYVADAHTEALLRERGLLRSDDKAEDFAEIFANLIAEILGERSPSLLVLDDYHVIVSAEVQRAVALLLDRGDLVGCRGRATATLTARGTGGGVSLARGLTAAVSAGR